jgi:hypothetical protein
MVTVWEKVAVPVPIITTNKRENRFFIKVDVFKIEDRENSERYKNKGLALVLILVLKEKRPGFQSEKQNESEGKRKSAITFVIALFFIVERSIELSNLIHSGLEQIEEHFNPLN